MVWLRRWFVLGPATKVEYDLRTGFYSRLQRLPVVVPRPLAVGAAAQPHDAGHQHAAPLDGVRPRAAGRQRPDDRRRHGAALPLALAARHDLPRVLAAAVVHRATGSRRRTARLARQSQDQAGDLATSVEESVHGIRVLKAFGRGKHALHKFTEQAETLRQTELRKARRHRRASGSGWCCCPTSRSRCASARASTSSSSVSCSVPSSSRSSRWRPCCAGRWSRSASCSRSRSTRARRPTASSRSSTRRTRSSIRPAPMTIDRPRGELVVRGRALPISGCRRPPSATCSTASTSCCGRARRWRSSASPARARRRSRRCPRACTT